MTGTKRCDGCWELERRIHRDPGLARKILKEYDDSICNICNCVMTDNANSLHLNCGGDCRLCMAESGDPDCIEAVKQIVSKL